MAEPERQQQVLELLKELRGIEPLKQLFWSELNYQRVNQPLSRRGWTESAAQALAEDPVLFAGGGENGDFHVIYGRLASDRLLLGAERPVVTRLLREHPYALFVFSNKTQDRWHFLNVKYADTPEKRRLFRRITVHAGEGQRTASERLSMLDLASFERDMFGLSALEIQQRHDEAFDVEKVTKDFYTEIANWYFWACDHVEFPMPKDTPNPAAYKAQSLIRLITRLIFCWFVKEKGLIPEELFDSRALAKLLKDGAKLSGSEETTFYKAILQNLFFATLNQEMGKRAFRKRHKDPQGRDPHRGITNLYRYEDYFTDPKEFLRLMDGIPFLNGGLFECLDKVYRAEEGLPDVRIDGFSDHPKNPLSVPDFLFFGHERTVDLSAAYGEKRYRQATVRGLIHTFGRYKFTITENTPLDQEVALDPELSGKVFENLLAAYNPETATTARKQTGSFYTPREIVDYMVDEALIAHLGTVLTTKHTNDTKNEERLRHLLAYTDEPHQFSPAEVETLIAAIDNLKALDPACGSGAFPMGLLHKLVFILGKLDPHNERWKQTQIAKASEIPDTTVREKTLADIEQAFAANELDYGRKLYLIENCIYGVDIQPIAVQIAKMRFFISLTVDQKIDPTAPNLGIRPLPNLETKFVAANTLIGIERPAQAMLRNPQIDAKEAELRQVRERHFTARTPATKAKCRELDAKLRAEISQLLQADGFPRETTEKLANWNPYDQNASADFFDPEWMFGIRNGFDIVIGNPPYVLLQDVNRDEVFLAHVRATYQVASYKVDLYHLFIERGVHLLTPRGCISFITPSNFASNNYTVSLRRFLLTKTDLLRIVFFDEDVFQASVNNLVFVAQKGKSQAACVTFAKPVGRLQPQVQAVIPQDNLIDDKCLLIPVTNTGSSAVLKKIQEKGLPLGAIATVNFGMQLRDRDKYPEDVIEDPPSRSQLSSFHRPCFTGKDIGRYVVRFGNRYCYFHRSAKRGGCWDAAMHNAKNKILVRQIGAFPEGGIDSQGYPVLNTAFMIIPIRQDIHPHFLLGVLNSLLVRFYWLNKFRDDRRTFPKIKGEYLKLIPIPVIGAKQQQPIIALVDEILLAKRADPAADTSALEREIDQHVYRLYGLTPEEIEIVEGDGKG